VLLQEAACACCNRVFWLCCSCTLCRVLQAGMLPGSMHRPALAMLCF
jgi:hypothetical protein